jgi:hypothetical protein
MRVAPLPRMVPSAYELDEVAAVLQFDRAT